jgi:hypothetical protein
MPMTRRDCRSRDAAGQWGPLEWFEEWENHGLSRFSFPLSPSALAAMVQASHIEVAISIHRHQMTPTERDGHHRGSEEQCSVRRRLLYRVSAVEMDVGIRRSADVSETALTSTGRKCETSFIVGCFNSLRVECWRGAEVTGTQWVTVIMVPRTILPGLNGPKLKAPFSAVLCTILRVFYTTQH